MSKKRMAVALLLLASVLMLLGCPQGASIAEIQRDPGRYANKEVGIRGRVVSSFGALGTGMYEIDDGTGRMWVMSQKSGVPGQGARVSVAGHVVPTVTFAGRSFATVLRETDRRD